MISRDTTECQHRSAHTIKVTAASPLSLHERAQSKEDKNKLNSMRATSSSDEQQNNPWQPQHASGRDSVDYHQYLEKIEKFRVNNPKVYNRPLQKNVPTVSNSKVSPRAHFHRQQQQQQQQQQ